MKVLYLVPIVPYPPDGGAKIHLYNKLRYLGERHEVHFVCFCRPGESKHLEALQPYCRRIYAIPLQRSNLQNVYHLGLSMLVNRPFKIVRDFVPAMQAKVQHLLTTERFDIVHVDEQVMAQHVLNSNHPARLLDKHNTMWLQYRRMWEAERSWWKRAILNREWRRLREYEGTTCALFDRLLVLSEQDKAALEAAMGDGHSTRIDVMSIATDTSLPPIVRKEGSKNILSVGSMFFLPNVQATLWFAEEVFPFVKKRVPEAQFHVIGARPPKQVRNLAQKEPGIRAIGYAKELHPYVEDSALMVVPLRSGGGMRWKILNAFVQGIPVVSTAIGCEGFDLLPGKHLLVADEPRDFAEAVCHLLQDSAFAQELADNARSLVERKYDWRIVYRHLDEIYQQLA
jgi:glycosyltransferase involved in cell wall biosynthesis